MHRRRLSFTSWARRGCGSRAASPATASSPGCSCPPLAARFPSPAPAPATQNTSKRRGGDAGRKGRGGVHLTRGSQQNRHVLSLVVTRGVERLGSERLDAAPTGTTTIGSEKRLTQQIMYALLLLLPKKHIIMPQSPHLPALVEPSILQVDDGSPDQLVAPDVVVVHHVDLIETWK